MALQGPVNAGVTSAITLGTYTTAQRNAGVSTVAGTMIYNSDTVSVEAYLNNKWTAAAAGAVSATGGTKSTSGLYTYHHFTSVGPAPFSVTVGGSMDIFVVGGGGGGGYGSGNGGYGGGGGGGGGIAYKTGETVAAGSYTVVVGDGGSAGTNNTSGGNATDGGDSAFGPGTPIPYVGNGGGAGRTNGTDGADGGSGGGGGRSPSYTGQGGSSTGNIVPPGGNTYGNAGGNSINGSDPFMAGGGGGAGAAGQPGGTQGLWPIGNSGRGGDGIGPPTIPWLPTSYGESGYFAGGGGGGGWSDTGPSNTPGVIPGGNGGGGDATHGVPTVAGTPGTANTGGGGGGGQAPGGLDAGNGGSGIVIIRYLT